LQKEISEQQKFWQSVESSADNASNPGHEESSPALPAQPETSNDKHLAGLLTYAFNEP
jgi:hypothetical protein